MAYVFYRRSLIAKEPYWSIRTATLIEGYGAMLSDLEVSFGGKTVENLAVSRIAFWNAGRDTIDAADIATANPLRIRTTNDAAEILDVKLIAANSASSGVGMALTDARNARLTLAYLDRGQGAVFQVVHTGTRSSSLDLVGDIKGAAAIRQIPSLFGLPFPLSSVRGRRAGPRAIRVIASFMNFYVALTGLVMVIAPFSDKSVGGWRWPIVGLGIAFFLAGAWTGTKAIQARVPNGLREFEAEIIAQ
jgi:hypothetical protein